MILTIPIHTKKTYNLKYLISSNLNVIHWLFSIVLKFRHNIGTTASGRCQIYCEKTPRSQISILYFISYLEAVFGHQEWQNTFRSSPWKLKFQTITFDLRKHGLQSHRLKKKLRKLLMISKSIFNKQKFVRGISSLSFFKCYLSKLFFIVSEWIRGF